MARYAVIDSGIVINTVEANDSLADSQGWINSDTAKIGDSYDPDTGAFNTPPAPAPQVPQAVPALEALLALDAAGLAADYEAWANDPARTFAERAFINKALTWRREDPVLNAAGDALGLTEEQKDQLFIAADQALEPV